MLGLQILNFAAMFPLQLPNELLKFASSAAQATEHALVGLHGCLAF